jgi:hypothetical protein
MPITWQPVQATKPSSQHVLCIGRDVATAVHPAIGKCRRTSEKIFKDASHLHPGRTMRGCSKRSFLELFVRLNFVEASHPQSSQSNFRLRRPRVSKPRRRNISPELGMVPASNCAISGAGTMKSDDIGVHATLKCNP